MNDSELKDSFRRTIKLYTEMTLSGVENLKERLRQERPEEGYKTLEQVKPHTLAWLKTMKEFCNLFDIPIKDHLKEVLN